ncbi:OmpP1/FadL family transporter [Candidatus Poribacteria bacterium]
MFSSLSAIIKSLSAGACRRKFVKHTSLTAALFLLITQASLAQEVTVDNDFGVGARAMGMGGAFIGVADDSTALHWNPAGLAQIKRMEFFGGLSHERLETDTEFYGSSDSTFTSNTRPNSFAIVLPVPVRRGGLAFAMGVNRVQSFDSRVRFSGLNKASADEDPEFFGLLIKEIADESDGIYSWNFGAAVEIAPGVSLGGTLNFLDGDYEYDLSLDADDTQGIDELTGFSFRDTIGADYFGVESKIGLLARLGKQVRLGATIDIPLDFSVDEYWIQDSFYLYDDDTNESFTDDGFIPYDISRPFRFGAGIAAAPVPGVIISADALYTDWTQTEYSDPPSDDVSNEDFKDDYRDTVQLRLGIEGTIPNSGVRLRAGYLRDPLPYTPDGLEIGTERQFITVGIGMILDRVLSLDIAYMRGFWDESTDDGVIEKNRDSNRIFVSAGYRF